MLPLPLVPVAVTLAAALMAAVTDLWKYRIYNTLTFPLLISGLIYQSVAVGGAGFAASAVGACLGFGAMFFLYLSGGLGSGDVKMMAGLGAWLGPLMTIQVLLASWLAAGVYSGMVLLYNWATSDRAPMVFRLRILKPLPADRRVSHLVSLPDRRRRLIPFGLMMLTGVVAAVSSAGTLF